MPLWPGPDRKFISATRIWFERPEARLAREEAEGRSARELEREAERITRCRLDLQRRREKSEMEQADDSEPNRPRRTEPSGVRNLDCSIRTHCRISTRNYKTWMTRSKRLS
jgi:hypothetical protein